MSSLIDLVGRKFGRLIVVRRSNKKTSNCDTYWHVKCSCGVEKEVTSRSLLHHNQKSCGCAIAEANHERFAKEPYRALFNRLMLQPHEVLLTYEDFVGLTSIPSCHYCGAPVTWAKHNMKENGYRYNLDRKDNSLGYSKENCVVCCKTCNSAKGNKYTYEEWKCMTTALRLYRGEVPNASQGSSNDRMQLRPNFLSTRR